MKILLSTLFLFCFLIPDKGLAQRHYPCETSRIGKLITKPLMKDGKVDYSLAVTSKEDKRRFDPDFVAINYDDPQKETYITRIHVCNKDTTLDLLMVYLVEDDECFYQLNFSFTGENAGERKSDVVVLNGQGAVRQNYGDQKEVDDLLSRYFK